MMDSNGFKLTNSQEEQLLHELGTLDGQIDIDPLPFGSFSFVSSDNLSQEFNNQMPPDCGQASGEEEYTNHSMAIDEKISIQRAIAANNMLQQMPTPILGKDEFAGDYNFQLILNYQNSGKHWVYSEKLCKVFIHMEQVLPLQFQWAPPTSGLWVRATLVYKHEQHRSQPVVRCHNHMAPDNNSNRNIDQRHLKHVIRCLHNTSSYDEHGNGHLSVLTPLGTPEVGINNVPMDFVFYCKNSCTSGMNRRPTEIIFTLENEQNQILGRRKLEVRVCSCPKRDKEKEESECDPTMAIGPGKKRKGAPLPPALPPAGKKMLTTDNKVYNISLNVVGKDNLNTVLKCAHDVMAGAAVRSGNYEMYKPYMDDVLRKYQ